MEVCLIHYSVHKVESLADDSSWPEDVTRLGFVIKRCTISKAHKICHYDKGRGMARWTRLKKAA